jgi:transposase
MEIITGVERRRRWRVEEKLRIVAEVERPGASFAEVARRHSLSRGLLWQWRDQVRRGVLGNDPAPVFTPVHVIGKAPATPADTAPTRFPVPAPQANRSELCGGRIEIALPDGTLIRVGEEIGAVALRRVLTALRR